MEVTKSFYDINFGNEELFTLPGLYYVSGSVLGTVNVTNIICVHF